MRADLGSVHRRSRARAARFSPAAAPKKRAIYSGAGAGLAGIGGYPERGGRCVRGQGLEAAGRDQGRARPAVHAALLRPALRGAVGEPLGAGAGRAAARLCPADRRAAGERDRQRAVRRRPGHPRISPRELVHALDTAATDDRVKAVALDLDIFSAAARRRSPTSARRSTGSGGGKPVVAYRHRLYRRQLSARRPCQRSLAQPAGRGAVAGPGGVQPLFQGPARQARRHRQRLPGRHLQVGGRALHPQRHVARGARGARRSADALWESWAAETSARRGRRRQIAPYVADRRRGRRRRAATWPRPRWRAGLVDRIGDRTRSERAASPSSPARTTTTSREATAGSSYAPYRRANPAATMAAEIGVLTVAGDIVDGKAGRHRRRRDDRQESRRACESGNLKALVVRVDSPGGSVLASERIRQACSAPRRRICRSSSRWASSPPRAAIGSRPPATSSSPSRRRSPARSACSASCRASRARCQARHRRRRGQDDAAVGRARPAARPSPEADRLLQGVESTYRRFLGLVAARALPPAAGRPDRPGPGLGRRHRPPARPGRRLRRLDDAIAEAARLAKLDPDDARHPLSREGAGLRRRAAARWRRRRRRRGGPPTRSPAGRRAGAMLARDRRGGSAARAPAIQARCLECPAVAPPAAGAGGLGAWLPRLVGA
jgi:protease-4